MSPQFLGFIIVEPFLNHKKGLKHVLRHIVKSMGRVGSWGRGQGDKTQY